MTCSAIKRIPVSRSCSRPKDGSCDSGSTEDRSGQPSKRGTMKDKAVFFATAGMVWCDDLSAGVPSATLSPGEWKALRLLTLAGYNIVLFTPEKSTVYADVQDVRLTDGGMLRSARPVAQRRMTEKQRDAVASGDGNVADRFDPLLDGRRQAG